MYSYIAGYTDTDDINYCPKCEEPISTHYVNGTGKCDACGFRFGVVEDDESEDTDNA